MQHHNGPRGAQLRLTDVKDLPGEGWRTGHIQWRFALGDRSFYVESSRDGGVVYDIQETDCTVWAAAPAGTTGDRELDGAICARIGEETARAKLAGIINVPATHGTRWAA